MWTATAAHHFVRTRIVRRVAPSIESAAVKSWVIAPGESSVTPRAYFLPSQLDRVTGWTFAAEHPRRKMEGGFAVEHGPTRGYLLKDARLIDGTLYAGNASSFLQPRSSRWPRFHIERQIDRAALFCSRTGNQYFGMWLMDDCVTYPLAAAEGLAVTTSQPPSVHMLQYEAMLRMTPTRLDSAAFRELVIFDDIGQNRNKFKRFRCAGERLQSKLLVKPHPGVFILRGLAGTRRLLQNEIEIAESLRDRRGFRIVDPSQCDVPTILAACAGAQTVVGVEGSGLMHGIMVLGTGGRVLCLQPPNRFVGIYKDLTDRDGQHFGFVVGHAAGDDFWIEMDEVERTLDLFPD